MPIHNKKKVAVIGATGYTGLDLILMLSKHPKIKITNLCATKNLGKKINFFDKRIKKNLPKISSVKTINWDTHYNDLPFNPSALSLYKWAPIADELKQLDRKIVLNSVILKWNIVKKEFEDRVKF